MANERKKLIFCAYAADSNMQSGENVVDIEDKVSLYMKNAVTALVSAKLNNPDCAVALVTNITVSEYFKKIFDKFDIKIFKENFDRFKFDNNYKWGLAFYKLCALEKVLTYDYDSYLFLDADTYTQNSLTDLWEETDYNVMLHNHIHRLSIPDCKRYNREVENFCGITAPLTNYSGGFIAGSKTLLNRFINICVGIYNEMLEKNFQTSFGDEFITRLAAEKMKENIKEANAYIETFWTNVHFYLTTTRYKYNAISSFHLPDEKNRGLIKVFEYIVKNGKLPQNEKVYDIFNMKHSNHIDQLKYNIKKCLKRI